MAEILGLGITHYPAIVVEPEHWSQFVIRRTKAGQVPAEVFENKAAWPAAMREEWADDQGAAAAGRHKTRLVAAAAKVREALDAFDPDFVVIWGDDQYENFRNDCIPAFCVYIFDHAVSRPYAPPFFSGAANIWGLPEDAELKVRGHRDGARSLCQSLLGGGFDIAYAYETRHHAGLAHSFNNALIYLDYERSGFPYPVVPFHVNCYGNRLTDISEDEAGEKIADMSPPSPSPKRCFEIGRATARFFADSPWRVALIASSSWSHANLTKKTDWLYPDIPSDRARLAELENGEYTRWADIDIGQIEDAGQHEFLNWICLAGAMAETDQRFESIDFIESHLFNSSKCFGVFHPA
jgi:hypothetical protein